MGHSLQATALVNEAYVRLVDGTAVDWHDRAHFLAVAARIMRRILVDHARARMSAVIAQCLPLRCCRLAATMATDINVEAIAKAVQRAAETESESA